MNEFELIFLWSQSSAHKTKGGIKISSSYHSPFSKKPKKWHLNIEIETTTSTNIIHHPWLWNVLLLLPSIPFHGLPVALRQSSWARHAHGTWSKHRKRSTSSEEAVTFRTTLSSGTRLPWQRAPNRGPSPGLFMSWAGSGQDKASESHHVYFIIGPHICSWICPNCEQGPRCQKVAYLGCRWDGGHWCRCLYCNSRILH